MQQKKTQLVRNEIGVCCFPNTRETCTNLVDNFSPINVLDGLFSVFRKIFSESFEHKLMVLESSLLIAVLQVICESV